MKKISILLAPLLLVACGSSDYAGGSGVEIPNSVTLVATHSDGTPVRQGMVKIVSDSKWVFYKKVGKPVVLDSMRTDSSGKFSFTPPEAEKVRIEIMSGKEGTSHLFDSTESAVSLAALASIQFQWKPGALVTLSGTSFSQVADPAGQVHFSSVPSVNALVIGEVDGESPAILSSLTIQPGQTVDVGQVQALPRYLPIDDFEEKSRITQLEPFVHGSYWFSIADGQQGGNSSIYPSTANGNSWVSAISDSAAFMGNSLRVDYSVKASDSTSVYAIFGCTLGNGIVGAAVDSISFYAYSDGEFALIGGDHTLVRGSSTVGTGWQRFSVRRHELDSIGFASSFFVLQFVFSDSSGTHFKLDNFTLHGEPFELLANE